MGVAAGVASAGTGVHRRLLELDDHGFTCLGGLLDPPEVRRLRRAAEGAAAGKGAPGGATHLLGAAFAHRRFTDLAVDERLLPLLAAALSPNLHLYHSHLDVHPAKSCRQSGGWHRDGGRMSGDLEVSARLSVKVVFWLTDLEHGGCGNLEVVPGSHRRHRAPGSDEEPAGVRSISPRAGDVMVFDRRLWHRRGANRSRRTRVALFFAYAPRWVTQREHAAVGLLARERCPVRRQILGAPDWDPCQVALRDLPVAQLLRDGSLSHEVTGIPG